MELFDGRIRDPNFQEKEEFFGARANRPVANLRRNDDKCRGTTRQTSSKQLSAKRSLVASFQENVEM